MTAECSLPTCASVHFGRGFCRAHYNRWRRHGDPLAGGPPRPALTEEERFWSKVRQTGLCWEWTGTVAASGYGNFSVGGRPKLAHRYAYEHLVGPIPEGMQIDHLCSNRPCVRPAHLEVVTPAENTRRGIVGEVSRRRAAAITHCPHGHSYDEANTAYRSAGRYVTRRCRACDRERERVRRSQERGS